MKAGRWILSCGVVVGSLTATERLLFDDYYQHPRDNPLFAQGVARGDADLRGLSNFYAPDATGIPNGTFVWAELMADRFTTEISRQPISAELLEGVGAYVLVCPVRESFGGRADLTSREADVLEAFVSRGGGLLLVANSISNPAQSGLDLAGLNEIGRRFGAQFVPSQTDTISVPIARDHPVFDGVSDIIFGNGALIEIADEAAERSTVLMTSHREGAAGPVAVLIEYGEGRVILLGDAGTLGNAHAFRGDTGHAEGLRQMMFALLPDGPMPRYAWREGISLRVNLREEQVISGYPEFMDVFRLPHPEGTKVFSSGMRQIDLEAAGGDARAAQSKDFVSVVAERSVRTVFDITAPEGEGWRANWRHGQAAVALPLQPNGRFGPPSLGRAGELSEWLPVLLHEIIAAPLRAHAKPGDDWPTQSSVRLPHLQLSPLAPYRETPVQVQFVGEVDYQGEPCFYFKTVGQVGGDDWRLADLVDPAFAPQIRSRGLAVQAGGLLTVSEFWIHRETRLPVHTRVRSSAAVWWQDPRFPARYVGRHDSKNYENWATTNFVATIGRVLTADFTPSSTE